MIPDGKEIAVQDASYIGGYVLELKFNDQVRQKVDFYPFLAASRNLLIRRYLKSDEFLKFAITEGDLEWNDYDLCFPIADLYENKIF